MLEHGVGGVKELDGDHDERLLGLFALGPLAQVDRAPLGTTADGVDGGEVEGMPGDARPPGREPGRGGAFPALVITG
jgi:hypothetical protein